MEDIVELQRDGEGLALEEALRQLGIPDELVGVHRGIVVATTALHVHIGGEGGTPGGGNAYHTAIGELPRVEVVVLLQVVTRTGVANRTVELDLEPLIAVAGCEALIEGERVGDALLRLTLHIDAGITDVVVETDVGEGVDIEEGCRVDGGIEDHTGIAAPVAVDILWLRDTGTGGLVERHLVADGVARGVQSCPGGDGTLPALGIVVVEDTQVLGERGFQSWVTLADVQRVAIVGDIEQVAHRGLAGVGIILHAQLADLGALPAEVECRRDVGDGARGVGMQSLVVLQEVRTLRNEAHADVEVEGLAHDAEHQFEVVGIVLVLRESAQVAIEIGFDGLIGLQERIPGAVVGFPPGGRRYDLGLAEVVGAAVALRIVVAELIDELEIDLTEDGLAVGEAGTVVPVLRRSEVIAADEVGGVLGELVELHEAVADGAAFAIAPVAVELEGDVTACGAELTVELEHTAEVLGVAVADIVLIAGVLDDTQTDEGVDLIKRIGDMLIGVLVEGALVAEVHAVVGVIAEGGAEQDVGHRVGHPLDAHLSVPAVGARIVLREAVAEHGGLRIVDLLTGATGELITIGMIPAHATVELELILLLVVEVHAEHLGGVQSLSLLSPSATAATAREAHVVDIVGTGEEHHAGIVLHHGSHASA